jgi:signal transduction histidine kinase
MNVTRLKWIAALLPALFVGLFEFIRHDLLDHIFPNELGNLMVAGLAAAVSLLYYHGIFTLLQNLNSNLQEEKEEKATLKERDRIAHELHDSVAQALFFMNIKAKEIEAALHQQRHPLEEVREMRKAIKITDADVRQHIFNLQTASQANIDLVRAIQAYIENFQEQSGIQITLSLNGDFAEKLSNREKYQLIRIFQEVLWNIRKHAEAERIKVSIIEDSLRFMLVIQDNGKGFNMPKLKEKESTFGLRILEERAHAIGAKFNIESIVGKGTTVTITLDMN